MARGGIDLGGTKIQAVVVDGRWKVLGESRRPTPTTGGPEGRRRADGRGAARSCRGAGMQPEQACRRSGSAHPATSTQAHGDRVTGANLPGWDGTFQLGRWLARRSLADARACVGNDVQVATEARVRARRRQAIQVAARRLLGHRRRRRDHPRRQAVARPRRRRRDRAHGRQARRRPVPVRAARAAWRPTRDARRWRPRPARSTRTARKTDLFKIMEKHGRDRLTSGIWERALEGRRPARHRADRTGGGGARRRHRLGPQPARRRGRDHRRRARHPPGRALREANPRGDDAAPVQRLDARRTCWSPRWATWAARSAQPCRRSVSSPQAGRAGPIVPSAAASRRRRLPPEIPVRVGRQRLKRLREQVSQPAGRRASSHLHLIRTGAEHEALDSSALAGRRVIAEASGQPGLRPVAPRCRPRHRTGPRAIPRARSPTRRAGAPTTTPAPRRRAPAG